MKLTAPCRERLLSHHCEDFPDFLSSWLLVSTKSICGICTLKLFFYYYPLSQQLGLDLKIKALLLTVTLLAVNKLLKHYSPECFTRMTKGVNSTEAPPILWISVLMHT